MRVAFTGKSGAGKTSAARMVRDSLPYGTVTLLSLATPIKALADDLWPDAPNRRRLLQYVGKMVRRVDADAWVNRLLRTIGDISAQHIAVDDVRFVNEAEILRRHGFTIVRVVRPNNPNALVGHEATDVSETEMDSILPDYHLVAASLGELKLQLAVVTLELWP